MTAFPAAPPVVEPVPEWGRLDPRMIVVKPLNELIGLLPLLFALVFLGNVETWRVVVGVGTVALIILYGLFAWLTTKYRITDAQVELHTGVVFRQRRAIPRDRIRTVDLTAKLGHRLFGLSAVRVGTGQQERQAGEGVVLDAVTTAEAERLRQVFLHRPTTAATSTDGAEEPAAVEITRLDRRWYRYAPLSLSGLLGIAIAVGFGMNLAGELNLRFSEVDVIRGLFGWLSGQSPALVVLIAAVVVVLLSTVASLLTYLLQNHDFRLTRHADATVRVRRGLLTTRSVSIEEQRLRGVALHEPLLLRAARGARLNAVTTGLGLRQAASSLLVPPAPRAESHRVAAAVIGENPTSAPLTRHPVAARRRRLVRAVAVPVVLTAALALLSAFADWPAGLWIGAAALIPLSVLIGLDRYRNLGHALTGRYLVSRSGSFTRRTVALQRTGIIGWRVEQSPFQRRARLVTLTATTAAGHGQYAVTDIGESDGVRLADAAVPDLLTPFLIRE
ncbi:PH domain-containing protein [Actinokineospora sp. UTMC 2448]|uniref:PH domain-containing protein n=1 Tax=Actinokineospora sp. UTMC 2448 TaxID=2268449 RepID=UPI002164B3BB|nr:PH domain-containing protein [Actinokineospora sp. UTMC 2448]UVS77524.1 Bacterial membrane flanked domain protein [Actinokineospora sp. UTMC 2448]